MNDVLLGCLIMLGSAVFTIIAIVWLFLYATRGE